MPPGSWETHPDLRKLRRETDREFREEAAAEEADAAQLLLRNRTLADAAFESMVRSDEVTLAAGGREWSGRLVEAAGDLTVVDTGSQHVSISLSALRWLRIDARGRGDGHRSGGSVGSLRAQLGVLEMDAESVEIVTTEGGLVEGRVRAVGRDHLDVIGVTGLTWMVALSAVAAVVVRR
jgi:hypothetical protein